MILLQIPGAEEAAKTALTATSDTGINLLIWVLAVGIGVVLVAIASLFVYKEKTTDKVTQHFIQSDKEVIQSFTRMENALNMSIQSNQNLSDKLVSRIDSLEKLLSILISNKINS